MSPETKTCQNCKNSFTVEPEDFEFYAKIKVPAPTFCPECRYWRRLVDRNEWNLYRRKCDMIGEQIVSIYREDVPFPVYKQDAWRSDAWDPLAYGRDFDFNRHFFEQFQELRNVVPHLALVSSNSVNSEYSNQSQDNKDCYMVSATGGSEKCMYGNWYQPGSYFCADCYMIEKSERCYECINCGRCASTTFSQDCFDCVSCHFSFDCRGCTECFGCVGLRNKQYCWFNEQLSKEEYAKRLEAFTWSRPVIEETKKKVREFAKHFPRKFYHGAKNEGSFGDYLENTSYARLSFNCRENRDTAYLQDAWKMIDCLDMTEILGSERSYEIQGCADVYRSIGLRSCWTMNDCYYCDMTFSSSDCFGCFGLKQKQYCILNKQYSKEDYHALKEKIIEHMKKTGEWGEYFPPEGSSFAYNESVAYDFFSLSESEAQKRGYRWYTPAVREYNVTVKASALPLTIDQAQDSILKEVIGCVSQETEEGRLAYPECATAFRLIPLELDLYRELKLPIPQKCFPCRRRDRFSVRNPRKLWGRHCQCQGALSILGNYTNASEHFHGDKPCPNEFKTSYAPERPEIVYCERCYQNEVV